MNNLIVSQGRIADRADNMIAGAAIIAKALEEKYGLNATYVGKPTPSVNDSWQESLPLAKNTLEGLRKALNKGIKENKRNIMLANTCSASLATLPVVAEVYPDARLLWIDAHGDFNTPETTESGYLGGMVVAAACGLWDSGHGSGLNSKNVILIGSRDIDPKEQNLLNQAQVKILPPSQVNTQNILDAIGGAPVWIHIDWDVLEPGYLPADYQVPNGLTVMQIKEIFQAIPLHQILGVELAEFNASSDEEVNENAKKIILDIIAGLFE
ncbi:arginase family protein [Xenorhabdus eapokensis]|uniref:Arginase n=1 Tax=Xenorhabdus eapokensis TaxID=1873482 RepID=A0A1Q5TFR2_9GAMM|nr:arginase family protein [Xenorhabdus eapokensis]OKO99073.1 arginase [Xenorhabdus eapokensis]